MDVEPKTVQEKIELLTQKLQMKTPEQVQTQFRPHLEMKQQKTVTSSYQRLFQNFLPVPAESPLAPAEPVQEDRLPRKRRRRKERAIKASRKVYQDLNARDDAEAGLISVNEVKGLAFMHSKKEREKWAGEKLSHSNKTRGETMRDVANGDFSNFENLDKVMRNLVAGQALHDFMDKYGDDFNSATPEALCQKIQRSEKGVTALMDPALRLAFSLARKTHTFSDEQKDRFAKLDEAMSAAIMVETLTHRTSKEELKTQLGKMEHHMPESADPAGDAVTRADAQQIQMAKRLMLMHMGQLTKLDNNGSASNWDHPVAVALSHCSRVAVTMPKLASSSKEDKAEYARMWRNIFYFKDGSNPAADNARTASTHNITRGIGKNGKVKEKKVLGNLIGQRGMNVAIGGLGNAGINGRTLLNDGSCGHFYSMYKEGNTLLTGAILMGLESDSAGVTNQMGHTHDAKATGEKASSLGGQRADEIGAKYGGRVCSLKDMSATDIADSMAMLEDAMKQWQQGDHMAPDGVAAMKMLCGQTMTREQLINNFMPLLQRGAHSADQGTGGIG